MYVCVCVCVCVWLSPSILLLKPQFYIQTENSHGLLSAAMLPQVPSMDYDIIFPKDELDKANKDKRRYPPNFKVSSNVFLMPSYHMHLMCVYNSTPLPALSVCIQLKIFRT